MNPAYRQSGFQGGASPELRISRAASGGFCVGLHAERRGAEKAREGSRQGFGISGLAFPDRQSAVAEAAKGAAGSGVAEFVAVELGEPVCAAERTDQPCSLRRFWRVRNGDGGIVLS